MSERADLQVALAETGLAGLDLVKVAVAESDEVVFAIEDLDEGAARHAWGEARAALASTGRYPVVVSSDDLEQLFSRPRQKGTPTQIIAAAGEMSLEGARRRLRRPDDLEYYERSWDAVVEGEVGSTAAWCGVRPDLEPLLAFRPDIYGVERELLRWELRHAPDRTLNASPSTYGFIWPDLVLLLLPVQCSEHVAAYVDLFGVDERGQQAEFIVLLRHWRERFGAEVLAAFGTLWHLKVDSPLDDPERALDVAMDHELVTSHGGNTGRWYARELLDTSEWVLHNRP